VAIWPKALANGTVKFPSFIKLQQANAN
jgi:branched-chain amino acid transport system substrate-binding protein